jgi:hypothetical protein
MKYKIVVVRDRVADGYSIPQFVLNIGAAIRGFGDEVRRPHSEERPNSLNQHPEDYDLFYLGEYDDESGQFEQLDRPKQIAIGKDYV